MTKFSFEVPIKHLSAFDDLQDFILVLSFLCERPAYHQYLMEKEREGLKQIWIDNSFNELEAADDPHMMLYWMKYYQASRVVAPDALEWDSQEMLDSFLRIKRHIDPGKIIVVTHNFQMYKVLKQQGVEHFAVAYRKRPKWNTSDLRKVSNVHFLGLNNIIELIKCKPLSCDTSMPIKLAMKGMSLRNWANEGYPHIHTKDLGKHGMDFFNAELTLEEIKLARRNICQLKEIVNTKA